VLNNQAEDPVSERPQRFIVAEISKNWRDGVPLTPGLLAEAFEQVIKVNRKRGYRLHSFTLHRLMTGAKDMNETIIAVFELSPQRGGA
jgi:hypothetical protein